MNNELIKIDNDGLPVVTKTKVVSINTTPYINASAVKKLALKISLNTQGGKFTRVSKEFLEGINAVVAETVAIRVHRAPSKGKTL